jgi:hypothetical protein|tara:strand:+ start:1131 stop:1616 length:486 start_codon:yes stop_codon:yes gene_type:complete
MDYQDKHTETIVACARTLRKIQEGQIETILRVIQRELINKFPSIEGRDENGPVDWSYDIMNCDTDEDVEKTINRIDNIENKSWKCQYCGKDTYDVDIDYLFGFNHIECALNAEKDCSTAECAALKEQDDIDQLKKQFDEVVTILKGLQDQIERLDNKSPKF